jgi:uncharacterized membrane protein YGL010W
MLVSVNVLLSTFLFLPALFTEIPSVAFLSPVGLISAGIRGQALSLGHLAYGTVPLWGITVALGTLCVAMYREETLMRPGGGLSKLVDGLARLVRRRRRLLAAGVLAVPVALVFELFVLVFAVTLDFRLALVAFLVGGALVEEAVKALPAYASYARAPTSRFAPWVIGSLVGLGFFVGEKAAFGLGWVGFGQVPGGSQTLATLGAGSSLLLVLAPLVLHVLTATISTYAARKGKTTATIGWLAASVVHASYNLVVVTSAGGILP